MSHRFNRRGFSALRFLVLVAIGGFAADACLAQLPASKKSQLISLATQAKDNLGRRPYPSPQQVGQRVTVAASSLADYLVHRTSGERAANWLNYVDADPLVDAISADKSATEINNAARRLQSRLVGNIVGLEMPPLVKLRDETESLIAAIRYPNPERSQRWVRQQLDLLIKTLQTDHPGNSPQDAATLSWVVQSLGQSNQVPELVAELYDIFSLPNLVVTVDGRVIQELIARPVDRSKPVRDCILGTRVIGNGHLRGEVSGHLAPSLGRVQIDLVLTGQFRSDSVGYNGPVRLPSIGQGAITASRSLWIGEDGVSLSNVSSSASLNTTITSIQHPLRIVRRIASKQIAQKKPQADQIARQRFRNQVVTDFSNQTSQAAQRIGSGSGSGSGSGGGSGPTGGSTIAGRVPALNDVQATLKRLNLSPPTRLIGSTSHSVFVQATQRSGKQLAASTLPPSLDMFHSGIGRGDASLQIHESVIDNLASSVLGGRTMTGQQIDRLIGLATQASTSSPTTTPGSPNDPPAENFEIEFASLRPIIFELRDQRIRLGIRGNRFRQGERDLRSSLEITATYEPVAMGGYQVLRRTGIVEVDFPGSGRIGIQQVAQRRSIQKLFNDRFPETLLDQPVILPVLAMAPALSGRIYRARGIDAQNGWLTLTVR